MVPNALMDKILFMKLLAHDLVHTRPGPPICKMSLLGPRSSAAKITLLFLHLSADQMNTCRDPTALQIKGRRTAVESRLPVKGKTILTEISTNYSPIRLNFCTQPFLSMLPGLETTNTIMTMAMMAMAMMALAMMA